MEKRDNKKRGCLGGGTPIRKNHESEVKRKAKIFYLVFLS
jgi:hypothetical protein